MAARRARPARPEARRLDAGRPAPLGAGEDRARRVRGDPPRRPDRPPAVRLVPRELRGARGGGGERPRSDSDQDDRLPDERRVEARLGADRMCRGREAVGLPARAEGPVRRAAQHRVVARDGAGRRPRRPRVPGSQDPREDDPRRPPRAGRAPAVRPHRHGQLQRLDRAHLRGRRALHGGRGDRRRRRRPVQLRHRIRPAAALPQDPRRAVHAASEARRAHPAGGGGGRGRQDAHESA